MRATVLALLVQCILVECRAPSSICELRWTLEMITIVEVARVRLRPVATAGLASAAAPALACNTSQ